MVYTAACGALAALEYMVHTKQMPRDMVLLHIEIPSTLRIIDSAWSPPELSTTRQIGDEWLESMASAVLRVPSVLVPRQDNYLLNPRHHLFEAIQALETSPFAFDARIFCFPAQP